jgi:hypothetical protein
MNEQGRRQFLRGAAFASIGLAAGGLGNARVWAAPKAPATMTSGLMQPALSAFQKFGGLITERQVIGIADFTAGSGSKRFHLLNMQDGQDTALLVSHGKGSDPGHSGWVQNFSNIPGSEATSSGAYLVGESYIGKYGLSRRLIGLEPENDMAEARAIVIHPAWYVSEAMAQEKGKIGRSQGCFAFADADISQVLWQLPTGSLIYAGKV